MRNSIRKRSPPRAEIEPIHIGELLAGAGMTGFLSVLDPPVRALHLQKIAQASKTPAAQSGPELLHWFSQQAGALFVQLRRQQEALGTIAEVARRWNGDAEKLVRRAEAAKNVMGRQTGGLPA